MAFQLIVSLLMRPAEGTPADGDPTDGRDPPLRRETARRKFGIHYLLPFAARSAAANASVPLKGM